MAAMEYIAGPFAEADTATIGNIDAEAFNFPPERAADYVRLVGMEHFRAVRVDGAWAACLASIPCGQYFGGRSIPMGGIAAVAVAPEFRGRGVGGYMMRCELERLHAERIPLSALYPATVPLYRHAGYEFAGVQFEHKLSTAAIDIHDAPLRVRRERSEDVPRLAELYAQSAIETNGNVDRIEFFWQRVRDYRGTPAQGFVFEGDGGIEGYVFFIKRPTGAAPSAAGFYTIFLTDFVAATPAAARSLLAFLAGHYTQCDFIVWLGGPTEPLVQFHLREAFLRPVLREYWMLRIVHCAAALEARGYAKQVSGAVHLEIHDPVLPGNNGRIVVELSDGRAVVRPGGRGDVRLDVRGLAALYSGFGLLSDLRRIGYLAGSAPAAELLAAAMAGPPPWMRDPF